MSSDLLFRVSPYVAIAILLGGLGARSMWTRSDDASFDSELSEARTLFGGGRLWRLSLVLLLVIHVLVLALPHTILTWNAVPWRLYVLEGSGLFFGLLALGGWGATMWRHLRHTRSALLSDIADLAFLAVLLLVIVTGLAEAEVYRWGSSWGAAILTPYLGSLLQGQASTDLVEQMPPLVQLHVFSSFALCAVLPFCRVALFPIAAVHWTLARVAAPGVLASDLMQRAMRSPAAWIWPEDGTRDFAWEPHDHADVGGGGFDGPAAEPGVDDAIAYPTGSKT